MSDAIPTLAEQRIEAAVAAFREGLAEEALRTASVDKRPTIQPHHVNKAIVKIFWGKLLPDVLRDLVLDADEDDQIPVGWYDDDGRGDEDPDDF